MDPKCVHGIYWSSCGICRDNPTVALKKGYGYYSKADYDDILEKINVTEDEKEKFFKLLSEKPGYYE